MITTVVWLDFDSMGCSITRKSAIQCADLPCDSISGILVSEQGRKA